MNQALQAWVNEMAALALPEKIVWVEGGKEQIDGLTSRAVDETRELARLNPEKLPNCYIHRTAAHDVARAEHRNFVCTEKKEDAGPTNNWMHPADCYEKLGKLFKGSMKGRTMYVIPYSMGMVGSAFAKIGVELTDSLYVALSMNLMARIGRPVLDALGDSADFVRGLHSKGDLSEENRYICHFPEDNTIWSINSAYGGNALLGKKCFALRIASCLGRKEGWLAEHMLILGVESPGGDVKYIAAAFPSACGKTNLAMLIPPELYRGQGYKVWCVGDDIAWLRVGRDGRLWAVNPEYGFFGVAPGTNARTNPNALETTRRDTIFTNVALNLDDNTVWWEGLDKCPPENALNWRGEKWRPASGRPAAHPNSRFTSKAANCPCLSKEFENPEGVPISAIIFGGRRAKAAPLVYQATGWQNGVFVGSVMASETTAAADGAVGVVRRDPMAMLPFCGYNMGGYFAHWLEMGKKIKNPPAIFNVNWFRLDENGKFIWPGFGDNMRVLMWILDRCEGKAEAELTPIGYIPKEGGINTEGLSVTPEQMRELLRVDPSVWRAEAEGIREFYGMFGEAMPKELYGELERLEAALE